MRVLASRHYWYPRTRIDGLRRFAFVGDSNVFGMGVHAAEAFPARALALLNETTAVPVETVNLGIPGYNIWNSWLSFKQLPQIYDGVVFTLCNNDAQLFGRSFAVDYRNADAVLWKENHPYRPAIEACFDDIAALARDVPIIIGYCNLWAGKAFEHIADTMRGLCDARGLPFVNFYAHFVERRLAQVDLIVSDADHHPSALAHDAMARHLAQALRKESWLSPAAASEMTAVPDAIAAAADAMVAKDDYPRDAALAWAKGTLEAKRRLAARLDPDATGGFAARADAVAARLEETRRAWQDHARSAAICERLATSEHGLSGALNHVEEETIRLEELNLAIDKGGWTPIAADLLKTAPAAARQMDDVTTISPRVAALRTGLDGLQSNSREAQVLDSDTSAEAARLVALARERAARFGDVVHSIAQRLADNDLDRDTKLVLATLAERSAGMAMERLERLCATLAQLFAPHRDDGFETALEVLIRSNGIEGRHPCLVELIANYTTPKRLPMRDCRYFLPDGEPKRLSMRLPLFYAGRLVVSLRIPPAVAGSVEADIEEIRLTNASGHRTVTRAELTKDNLGRLLSPQIWLV